MLSKTLWICLSLAAGSVAIGQTITHFPVGQQGAPPPGIVAGADRAMWFVEYSTSRVGRIDSSGVITDYFVEGGPASIAAGADGNLWLALGLGQVARLSTGGAVTTFQLPSFHGEGHIALGPDANLWVTEFEANRIARVTPGGIVTEFPLPAPNRFPTYIAPGPDGALWFSEQGPFGDSGALRIGRITTAGVVTEFPLDSAAFGNGLAAGPDGNLWIARPQMDAITRMTPAGLVTTFPLPAAGSFPSQITAGPDGAMWFTERLANRIGRITMSGTITEFPLPVFCPGIPPGPATCMPEAIARGNQGDLWFTDVTGLGRVALPAAGPCPVAPDRACLNGQFLVSADWDVPEQGTSGHATAVQMTADAAYFWFFTPNNVEVVVKVVDGRAFNGKFWVFYGSLSDVHYTITVRDTVTGVVRTYVNSGHQMTSASDTTAF